MVTSNTTQQAVISNTSAWPFSFTPSSGIITAGGYTGGTGSFSGLVSTSDGIVNGVTIGQGSGSSNGGAIFSNTAFGVQVLLGNNGGNDNSAFGYQALISNTSGDANSAFGRYALQANTKGNDNTALGYDAGYFGTTGSQCTYIGSFSGATASIDFINSTAIGYKSLIFKDNQIVLGNSSIVELNCQVQTISGLSDARDKDNIKPITQGLDFINDLNPVKFTWNMRDGGKVGIDEFGFIAQELKETQEKLGVVPNLVNDSNPEKLLASYGTLLPVMVKAIQELKAEIVDIKKKLE